MLVEDFRIPSTHEKKKTQQMEKRGLVAMERELNVLSKL